MKKLIIAIGMMLIAGCVPQPVKILHPDVAVFGDSLCAYTADSAGKTYPQITGIQYNCVPSRPIVELADDLPEYQVIFLALITNDVGRTPIDEYRASLQRKLISTEATVYCVLAARNDHADEEPYNQVMRDECVNVIDPRDYGVGPRAADKIHWTPTDHQNFAAAITERI